MVIVDRWQRFWSLILEFSCSMGFIVSPHLHLVTSFAWMHFYEATRVRKYIQLSYFFAVVEYVVYSSALLVLPNNKIKLLIFASHPFGFYPHTWSYMREEIFKKTTSNLLFLSWNFKP
jgi:hypothetical protein